MILPRSSTAFRRLALVGCMLFFARPAGAVGEHPSASAPPILRPAAAPAQLPTVTPLVPPPPIPPPSAPPAVENLDEDAPVRVSAHVEAAEVTPGRPFQLWVEVDRREDHRFELPDLGSAIRGLVVVEHKPGRDERVGDRVVRVERWTLKAPKSGTYLIPGVEAPWTGPEATVGTAGTAPIAIEARFAGGPGEGDAEALFDIRPATEPKRDLRFALAAAVAIALGTVAVLLWRRRRKGASPTPQLSPEERLERVLAEIAAPAIVEAEDAGPFAFGISEAFRRYLGDRFGLRAVEMTTPEVLAALPVALARDARVQAAVQEVLEASDLVKFAREPVGAAQKQRWIAKVREVVAVVRAAEERSP